MKKPANSTPCAGFDGLKRTLLSGSRSVRSSERETSESASIVTEPSSTIRSGVSITSSSLSRIAIWTRIRCESSRAERYSSRSSWESSRWSISARRR